MVVPSFFWPSYQHESIRNWLITAELSLSLPGCLVLCPISDEVLVLDPEVLDQPLQLKLLGGVVLDLPEPAVGKVKVGIASVGHGPVEEPVQLVNVH